MNTRIKNNIYYVFSAVLLVMACMCTSSLPGTDPTLAPPTSPVPADETVAAPPPTASPVSQADEPPPAADPGSFEDFRSFASRIAAALQAEDPAFFYEHASASSWLCLGDETAGVCKGVPADTTLEGTPVTLEWDTYEVYSKEGYRDRWQTTFAEPKSVELAAIAHRYGDNPFMPMAFQASSAILKVSAENDPASMQEVRVLFFENLFDAWILRGELVSVENADAWLNNTCSTCYDTWEAWQE